MEFPWSQNQLRGLPPKSQTFHLGNNNLRNVTTSVCKQENVNYNERETARTTIRDTVPTFIVFIFIVVIAESNYNVS